MIKTIGQVTANYCYYCKKQLDNWNDLMCFDCYKNNTIQTKIPESPKIGEIYYDKNTKNPYVWDGFDWNKILKTEEKSELKINWYKCGYCNSRYDYNKHSNCPNCGGT